MRRTEGVNVGSYKSSVLNLSNIANVLAGDGIFVSISSDK